MPYSFTVLLLILSLFVYAEEPLAFPGAEGCGKYTTGGRGGKVVYVTNLNDSGEGSLRHALSKVSGTKTILFKVSGTIVLESILEVDEGNFTLAGQSAPGDGICIAAHGMDIEADNIIIRYLRFRPGDIHQDETDALTIKRSTNVIIDHCSMSWSTDETCSCYDNTNFTLQWCIVSESLNNSVHHKGAHGYGGIWGGKNATFHHNLLAHHVSRNPRLHGSRYHKEPELEKAEIVNNVVYNWKSKCIYGGEDGNYAITGNYFIPGPATGDKASRQILEPYLPFSNYYFEGNTIEGNKELTEKNTLAVKKNDGKVPLFKSDYLFTISDYPLESPVLAYEAILLHVGASLFRDAVDQRIINDVKGRTFTYGNKGIINSQKTVNGWPELKSVAPPQDSDSDGIPDTWESQHQLNPQNPEDGNDFTLEKEYTNLEVYLNSLCKTLAK